MSLFPGGEETASAIEQLPGLGREIVLDNERVQLRM